MNYPLLEILIETTGLITHFLAECPSRPLTTPGDAGNNGAVWMPYYLFNQANMAQSTLKKEAFGTSEFNEQHQCINSNCQSSSKTDCSGNTCVCYDTWPLGNTYYPTTGKAWENPDTSPIINNNVYQIQLPCSGRGVWQSNGTCTWRAGFEQPNCQVHCSEIGTC